MLWFDSFKASRREYTSTKRPGFVYRHTESKLNFAHRHCVAKLLITEVFKICSIGKMVGWIKSIKLQDPGKAANRNTRLAFWTWPRICIYTSCPEGMLVLRYVLVTSCFHCFLICDFESIPEISFPNRSCVRPWSSNVGFVIVLWN